MNKRNELDNFTTVFTNADLADTPEGSMEECQNLRRLPGKLVKTYGAGYIQDGGANVCPITVASGYSVINIFCYINENLTDGREYIALIQNDSTQQVWIVKFDSTYNASSSEPSILLPFAGDSFWVEGSSQTFGVYGRVMLTNISVTGNTSTNTETLPITFGAHMPQSIEDTDVAGSIAYGGVPGLLGDPLYEADDSQVTGFDDTIGFDNEDIHTFTAGGYPVARIENAGDYTFAIVSENKSPTTGNADKLWVYDSGWTALSIHTNPTFLSGFIWNVAQDSFQILNITEFGGDLIVSMYINDNGTNLIRIGKIAGLTGAQPFTYTPLDSATPAGALGAGGGFVLQDSVTTAKYTVSAVDYISIYYAGQTTGTNITGNLFRYNGTTCIESDLTSSGIYPADGDTRDGVGICANTDKLILLVNNSTATANVEIYDTSNPQGAIPTWATSYSDPASSLSEFSGLTGTWLVSAVKFPITISQDGADTFIGMVATMNDGSDNYYNILRFEPAADKWTGSDANSWIVNDTVSVGWTIDSLKMSAHPSHTGDYVMYGRSSIYTSFQADVMVCEDGNGTPFSVANASRYTVPNDIKDRVIGLCSYVSLHGESDVIASVSFLMGTYDSGSNSDNPQIRRGVSFGANPSCSLYSGNIEYYASFNACMGWIELFQSLSTDQEFDLYHKADRNPIVMDSQILRIYPGAVGEITPVSTPYEAKGLWYGYIDRDFYDGLYSAGSEYTAGFRAYDKTPLTPIAYTNSNTVGGDIALDGWDTEDTKEYIRYSFMYDGDQESLLSPPIFTTIATAVDKAVFRLKLYDGTVGDARDNPRITGIRIYSVPGSADGAVATLIREVNFTLKASDRTLYSTTGKAALHVWLSNISTAQKALITGYLTAGSAYVGHGDGSLDAYFTEIVSFEDLSNDGCLILLSVTEPFDEWDGDWHISDSNAGGKAANIQFSAPGNIGGYFGENVLKDTDVDFSGLNPIGLSIASTDLTGNQAFVCSSDKSLAVLRVAKYALEINSDNNTETAFKYHIDAQPYVFYTSGTYYSLFAILDFANTQGDAYGLQGVKYTKVNPDFAKVMSGRLFWLSGILDPGGENEERLASLGYSEYEQYDVLPVGNLIKFNDREGGGGTGLEELFGRPVVTFKQGISILNVSDVSPSNWVISESPHNIGNIAKQGMVSAQGKVYVCYYDGIYALTANNLAETDMTPTDRLKISFPIEDKYLALSQTQKEAIVGEYDQAKEEILWQLGDEQWAFSTDTGYWREVLQYITGTTKTTIDIITIDENADLMFYDETDDAIRSFTNPAAVPTLMRTKKYNIAIERDELLRYMWVFNPYSDAMTITPYMDGVALPTTVVSASTAKQKIVIKRRGLDFQVQVSWASSSNNNELKRVGLEYDN